LRVCARAAQYERDWHVDSRDFEAILALCREAGLTELNESFFRNLVGSSTVRASCLLVRVDGKLAGFSLVLLDSIALHEKLTVVSRRVKGDPVRSVLWLETLRFCLECGIGTYVSASELSLAVARPNELVNRSGWPGV